MEEYRLGEYIGAESAEIEREIIELLSSVQEAEEQEETR